MNEMFALFQNSGPSLMKGAWMSLQVLGASAVLSMLLGSTFGLFLAKRLRSRWLSPLIEGVVAVLRAVPFFVQLLIVYFVIPELLGVQLSAFRASWIALGVCSSAYVAQIMRGALDGVCVSQWEGAFVLGYSKVAMLRYIILPQAIRRLLPALSNELDAMLKSTAILASIGLLELTKVGQNIVSRTMEPLPIYLTLALFYGVMSLCLNVGMRTLERRWGHVAGQ